MIRPVLTATGVFAALVAAMAFVGGISKMDVSFKNDMQRHVVAEPYEAGDIIEVSPDGQRILGMLCDVKLPGDRKATAHLKSRYYNALDRAQPAVVRFVGDAVATILIGEKAAQADGEAEVPGTLEFTGETHRVVGNIAGDIFGNCLCDVAAAVVERKSAACIVDKSLIETKLVNGASGATTVRSTLAVSFREKPLIPVDLDALAGHCPQLNTQARAPTAQSCPSQSGYTRDVRARARLNLIREEPF